MDPEAVEKIRHALQRVGAALAKRLTPRLGKSRVAALLRRARDMRTAEAHEAAVARLTRDAALLLRIRAALTRMDQGRYGRCLRCEKAISDHRLKLVPWAAFCAACRRAIDSREQEVEPVWRAARTESLPGIAGPVRGA